MAKVNAPLLGFGASGQIGQSHVYASWRGVRYARRYTVPENPQTTAQSLTRDAFTGLNAIYKQLPSAVQDVWEAYAKGKPLTARNGFLKANIHNLRTPVVLDAFTFSQGARGGLAPLTLVATPGSGQFSCAITAPTAPTDWTLTAWHVAAIRDQDIHDVSYPVTTYGTDADPDNPIVLTGLTAAQDYQVQAWLEWVKPDLAIAYSVALGVQATTGA